MKITLTQKELETAVAEYIVSYGINTKNSTITFEVRDNSDIEVEIDTKPAKASNKPTPRSFTAPEPVSDDDMKAAVDQEVPPADKDPLDGLEPVKSKSVGNVVDDIIESVTDAIPEPDDVKALFKT